jgi:hypothetical protein
MTYANNHRLRPVLTVVPPRIDAATLVRQMKIELDRRGFAIAEKSPPDPRPPKTRIMLKQTCLSPHRHDKNVVWLNQSTDISR